MNKYFLQIPERCFYNPYVSLQAKAMKAAGWQECLPSLCVDEDNAAPIKQLSAEGLPTDGLRVAHVHWPEKLFVQRGVDEALHFVSDIKAAGWKIALTHHNLAPHEGVNNGQKLLKFVDIHHCFSATQKEVLVRRYGEALASATVFQHPDYELPDVKTKDARELITVGIYGRIRGYKRFVNFAEEFAKVQPSRAKLDVAGLPYDKQIDSALRQLAVANNRISYQPGFLDHASLVQKIQTADCILLPYENLWSSGVLALATQIGTLTVCPPPAMYDLGKRDDLNIRLIEHWQDAKALAFIDQLDAACSLKLPRKSFSWDAAAQILSNAYHFK
jgi:beta-1,4-mannosyltransferase